MDNTAVCDHMFNLRNVTGMTQAEFAKALGVSRSLVSAVENRKRAPSMEYLMGARRTFGLSVDALFDELNTCNSMV